MSALQVILADKYLPYEVTYEDCHVFNPGGFAGSNYTWSACKCGGVRLWAVLTFLVQIKLVTDGLSKAASNECSVLSRRRMRILNYCC